MSIPPSQVACSSCQRRALCLPLALTANEMAQLDTLVVNRKKVKQGEVLYHCGEVFKHLFAIRTGFFKTVSLRQDGLEQVTGFQMAGEMLGYDGIVDARHPCQAIALEDAEVCLLPFAQLEQLASSMPVLQQHLHKCLSREIVREANVMLLLANLRAEARVATFLVNLLQRLHARGYSDQALLLRMRREDIGSYLGMQLETVSRTLKKLSDAGVIAVDQKNIRILQAAQLIEMQHLR